MTTSSEFVNIESKMLMGYQSFGSKFLDYLRERIRLGDALVFDVGVVHDVILNLVADGNDKFAVSGTSKASDGVGNILDISAATINNDIQFENQSAIPYYVALKHTLTPSNIQINPRTGYPNYMWWKEEIGEKADPNSVVDNGNDTITFVIDSVTETSVDNTGRTALIYMKTPVKDAITSIIAIETCTVFYSGGQNKITTTGNLGQSVISTTSSDYEVVLLGPTVKRNTDLRTVSGYVFLGIITGSGVGNPPSVFTTTDQKIVTSTLSNISDYTRVESFNNRIKIEVKAGVGESGIDQIRVKNPSGVTKFRVNEEGDVWIEGDLSVTGTTTQQDVVQVNSSETITDNLTAGDDVSLDNHLIKGTWKHTDTAGTANHFYVDGSTGRVGIAGLPHASKPFQVSGGANITGSLSIANIDSDIIPAADKTYDLGDVTHYIDNSYINNLSNNKLNIASADGVGLGVNTNLEPATDDTYSLGTATYQWDNLYVHDLFLDDTAGRGFGSNLVPITDNTYSLGSATKRWDTIYSVNINFTGDFLPLIDDTQDIGSAAYKWAEIYGTQIMAQTGDTFISMPSEAVGALITRSVDYTSNTASVTNFFIYGEWENAAMPSSTPIRNGQVVELYMGLPEATTNAIMQGIICDTTMYNYGSTASATSLTGIKNRIFPDISNGSIANCYSLWTAVVGSPDSSANIYGILTEVTNLRDPVTNVAVAIDSRIEASTGSIIPKMIGIRTKVTKLAGSVTDGYGVYIDTISGCTNNWSIYAVQGDVYLGHTNARIACDFLPKTTNTFDLGSSTYYWANAYIGNLFYKTQATFDTYNDLELIEQYIGTGETLEIHKGGEVHTVEKGDASTLPWPMLGGFDPDSETYFIDGGDAICFLTGAIKQLYGKHKEEIKSLKEKIKELENLILN